MKAKRKLTTNPESYIWVCCCLLHSCFFHPRSVLELWKMNKILERRVKAQTPKLQSRSKKIREFKQILHISLALVPRSRVPGGVRVQPPDVGSQPHISRLPKLTMLIFRRHTPGCGDPSCKVAVSPNLSLCWWLNSNLAYSIPRSALSKIRSGRRDEIYNVSLLRVINIVSKWTAKWSFAS